MNKIILFGVLSLTILTTACNDKSKAEAEAAAQELANQKAMAEATREELEAAITERDELLELVNEVASDVEDIRNVEKIISVNNGGEITSKTTITNNLTSIKSTLAERRQKLAQLEAKLKDSKLSNNKLLATVESLRQQIDEQTATIEQLTSDLANAKERITKLGQQVDSLDTTVKTVTDERNVAQEEAVRQADLANECYYAVGSKKELKEHNIIESGFLRKTKIMQGDFDKTYFTKADKRTLKSIPLHSNKAKVVSTNQQSGSYQIVDENGQKVLKITNPSEFWGVSNYVVIQID